MRLAPRAGLGVYTSNPMHITIPNSLLIMDRDAAPVLWWHTLPAITDCDAGRISITSRNK